MDINRNNYESFFLLYLDRELNAADRLAVENFLNENADLQREFSLLQKTILWPSEYVFEQKESLYRKEEKIRFIPVYWIRMAAVFTLILAAGWFMMSISKNHMNLIHTREQTLAIRDSKVNPKPAGTVNPNPADQQFHGKKESALELSKDKELAEKGNPTKTIFPVKDLKLSRTVDQVKIPGNQKIGNQEIRNGKIQYAKNEQIHSTSEEALILVPKSNANLELQPSGNRNGPIDPVLVHMPIKVQTPAFLVAVAKKSNAPGNDDDSQQDIQTESSISVIALNDRNKAIAGFFKKLTKHVPAGEIADNNKKLRVSVFQFRY